MRKVEDDYFGAREKHRNEHVLYCIPNALADLLQI